VIYGTTEPEPWQCKDLRTQQAILLDFCRHQVQFADYPGIIAEAGKRVKGTYVAGLTKMDIWRLDTFEGSEYSREVVKVKLLDGDGIEGDEAECSVYVYQDESGLVKEEWDFEHFVRERMHRWVGESKEYDGSSFSPFPPPPGLDMVVADKASCPRGGPARPTRWTLVGKRI
jgi:hypothetical protein